MSGHYEDTIMHNAYIYELSIFDHYSQLQLIKYLTIYIAHSLNKHHHLRKKEFTKQYTNKKFIR